MITPLLLSESGILGNQTILKETQTSATMRGDGRMDALESSVGSSGLLGGLRVAPPF